MNTAEIIDLLAASRGNPVHHVSSDDELRAYTALVMGLEELAPRIARHTNSPTRADYFVHLVERAHRATGYAQLTATALAQRTLVHELPADTLVLVNACLADAAAYIDGARDLPGDPATPPSGRPTFKNTIEFLHGTLRIGFVEARNRVRAASRLLPHTDVHGVDQPAQFPLLAEQLATGKACPGQLADAARKLERLEPEISQYPNSEELASQLEAQVAESVREEDPRTTNRLFNAIEVSLEQGVKEPSQDVLRAKVGMFYRGTSAGISEFLLRTRAGDAEVLFSLCAQTDNPRTNAGDRDTLLAQSISAAGPANGAGNAPGSGVLKNGETQDQAIPGNGFGTFPDFLVDPATGRPLSDAADAKKLALDPLDPTSNIMGYMNGTSCGPDGLTAAQRHLQGLMNLIKTNGVLGQRAKTPGLPAPRMFIVTTVAELEERAAQTGLTSHGQRFTPAELRQQLCTAGAIPIIMNGKSRILDLGTEERFFPDYMRSAILAIYGGCLVPGCTVPPEHCEIHHFDPYRNGGKTEVNSGFPACSNHHHGLHAGLFTAVRHVDGLFSILLPEFMDPDKKPRRNSYWRQDPKVPPLLF